MAEILITDRRVAPATVRQLAAAWFGDMVKIVVDVERRVAAIGGHLHADAEALLLQQGSQQEDLWGANYYPDRRAAARVEYTALINIRPGQGNRSMEIQDPAIRVKVAGVALEILAGGEAD